MLARINQGIIPDGVFSVVLGTGATGAQLVSDPRLGLVSITGSVRAGIAVAAAAAADDQAMPTSNWAARPRPSYSPTPTSRPPHQVSPRPRSSTPDRIAPPPRPRHRAHLGVRPIRAGGGRQGGHARPGGVDDEDAFYGPLNNIRHFTTVTEKIAALPDHAKIETGGTRVGAAGSTSRRPSSPV